MKPQLEAKVEFPIISANPQICWVKVLGYPQYHNGKKSCSFDDKKFEIKKILGHARHGEGIETIDIDIVVQFGDQFSNNEPQFDGLSYGLALTLADKRARYGIKGNYKRIIATGVLQAQGKIGRVEGFKEKLKLIIRTLDEDSLFVFPKENEATEDEILQQSHEVNGTLRAVEQLSELSDLWQLEEATGDSLLKKPRLVFYPKEPKLITQTDKLLLAPALKHPVLETQLERLVSGKQSPLKRFQIFIQGMIAGFGSVMLITILVIIYQRVIA